MFSGGENFPDAQAAGMVKLSKSSGPIDLTSGHLTIAHRLITHSPLVGGAEMADGGPL